MKKVLVIIALFLAIPAIGEKLGKYRNLHKECSENYWTRMEKLSEDGVIFNLIPTQRYLETQFGYTFIVVSEGLFRPCEMSQEPLGEIYRGNDLTVRKDGKEVYHLYWLGGIICTVSFQLYDDGNITVDTGELEFAIWQRNGKPSRLDKVLPILIHYNRFHGR